MMASQRFAAAACAVAAFSCLLGTDAFVPAVPTRKLHQSSSQLYSIPDVLDTLTSGLSSLCRLPRGVTVAEGSTASKLRIKELYDVENSPDCRAVRELVTELDLVVSHVIPSAANGRVFTDDTYKYKLPKDATLPRMVVASDDDDKVLSGKEDIVSFLKEAASLQDDEDEQDPKKQAINIALEIGGIVGSWLRLGRGNQVCSAATKSAPAAKPLVLYSYEGNQFCRLVREVLTELDLVYELRSAGKGSPRRNELAAATGGSTQCPYLLDPNTDTALSESKDIIAYLYKTYGQWTPPNELLQWASDVVLPLVKPLFQASVPLLAGSSSKEDTGGEYEARIAKAKADIEQTTKENPVVVYTYSLSPFSAETKALLANLDVTYKEVSLGAEWIPGLMAKGGAETRAALLDMTGQSSLPHVFVGGKPIGGLYSGTPGLVPGLEDGSLMKMIQEATTTTKAPLKASAEASKV